MDTKAENKKKQLEEMLRSFGKVAVALSGGSDSSFLARVAFDILGHDNFLAVFVNTVLQPPDELGHVQSVADEIGCRLLVIDADPFEIPEFVLNPSNRCYYCKKNIFSMIKERVSADYEINILLDGTNLDDLDDDRPGLLAIDELDIKTPLADSGLKKEEVRQLSRSINLSTWDRPSGSCLATRIPTGEEITKDLLSTAAVCEEHLHVNGFYGCRVRLSGNDAIIELPEEDIERFSQKKQRKITENLFKKAGIKKILLNITGRQ